MDCDLAIVGGGPAGISTALFAIAERPMLRDRILVLEKARYPRDKICAGAIGARADRLLATIGVRVDVPSALVTGLSVVARDSHLVEHVPGGRAIGRVVRRAEHDAALAEQARRRGIRFLEGARVTALAFDAAGVTIESTAGKVRARIVAGADGVGSFVRRAIGAPRGRLTAQVVEVDTPPTSQDPGRSVLHFDVADDTLTGYAWDFPTVVGGEPLVCRGVYELRSGDDDDEAHRSDVADRLRRRLSDMGIRHEGLPLKRFAERGLCLSEPMSARRVVLVGEAAGIDPVLGEGIAQAIQYGAVAGRYLARCLDRDDVELATWRREVLRSRVGMDLFVRTNALRFVYGKTRRIAERWVTRSKNLALAGMSYFAGEHVDRLLLARALVDLARAALAR